MRKLTPHNVTEDAVLLIETLLEAEPESFDPEAELDRLTTYTCPECGSTHTSQPDEEGLVDCWNCGIWFDFKTEARWRFPEGGRRHESANPPPPEPDDEEEKYQAYIDAHGAGPPRKEITHIETKSDYREYEERVKDFFRDEGIANLSAEVNEEGNAEPYFSWTRCQCCDRDLGGDRYRSSGWNPASRQVQEYSYICGDCIYYAEYGQLDDTTMLDLKDDLQEHAA